MPDYPQAELQHMRQKVLDLSAKLEAIRAAYREWKQAPVQVERAAALRELERLMECQT